MGITTLMWTVLTQGAAMIGGSFYFRDNPAFTGGSPQAVYEELWERGRKQRLIQRCIVGGVLLVLGVKLFTPAWGLVIGLFGAGLDAALQWWKRAALSVWRKGQRGERRTTKVLRYCLEWRGYRVLHGRSVPGNGNADHLVISPTGIWVLGNRAWDPETQFALYGGRLFVGKDQGARTTANIARTAETIAELLSARLKTEIKVAPLLVVHGGRLPWRGLTADGVALQRVHRLPAWLPRHGNATYTEAEINAIAQAAIHTLPIGDHSIARR